MGQQVVIKVRSRQNYGQQTERLTTESSGQLYTKQDRYYLKYQAELADQPVETTLKIKDNSLKLIRRGEIQTSQSFIPGRRTSFNYSTPYGSLKFLIEVSELTIDLGPADGRIRLEYDLFDPTDQLVSSNRLAVDYKEE